MRLPIFSSAVASDTTLGLLEREIIAEQPDVTRASLSQAKLTQHPTPAEPRGSESLR
jgi:hypothetical protein